MGGGRAVLSQSHPRCQVGHDKLCEKIMRFDAENIILRFRSPVFNAMFVHNMTESQEKKIDIEDLDIETVKDMLK